MDIVVVKPIAGPDEVVGRDKVVGSIGHNAAPTLATRSTFRRSRQSQLQGMSPMSVHYANTVQRRQRCALHETILVGHV